FVYTLAETRAGRCERGGCDRFFRNIVYPDGASSASEIDRCDRGAFSFASDLFHRKNEPLVERGVQLPTFLQPAARPSTPGRVPLPVIDCHRSKLITCPR